MVVIAALAAMMGMLFLLERAASVHAEETGETAAEDAGGTRGDAKEIDLAPINCSYDLKVSQTAANTWEAEPNGTTAAAASIQSGKTYNGITLSGKDDDYYKINAASAGKLIVKLNSSAASHPDNIHYGWNLYVYNSKLGELSRMEKSIECRRLLYLSQYIQKRRI